METFYALLAIYTGNSPVLINGWVNNREAGDLRRYHAHYDIIVMLGTGVVSISFNFILIRMDLDPANILVQNVGILCHVR